MKPVLVRAAEPTDAKNVIEWSDMRKDINRFDPSVITYRNSYTFCCEDSDGPAMYLPVHAPLMLESLAARPDIKPLAFVEAGAALLDAATEQAKLRGCGEVIFMATEGTVPRWAEQRGFERLSYTVYRKRI